MCAAINLLANLRGLGLGKRRFTVSTSGVPGKIRQLGEDEPVRRSRSACTHPMMKPARAWCHTTMAAGRSDGSHAGLLWHGQSTHHPEYVLLADANMRHDQAVALGAFARRYGAHINLIPFNPVTTSPHQRPHWDDVDDLLGP